MKQMVRLVVLLLSLTFLWGCELALVGFGAGLGIGAYKYIEGGVERDYPLEYNSAWDAANTALSNLYVSISDSINEGAQGKIDGVRKDGVKVIIKMKDKGTGITTIHVRVGFVGNRVEAEGIHDEIKAVAGLR